MFSNLFPQLPFAATNMSSQKTVTLGNQSCKHKNNNVLLVDKILKGTQSPGAHAH